MRMLFRRAFIVETEKVTLNQPTEMTDVDSRFIAFENDHTYLKTTCDSKDERLLQTGISTIGCKNDDVVFSTTSFSTKYQNVACKNETIQHSVGTLNVPSNSSIFLLSNPLNLPLSSSTNLSQNNLPSQKVNIVNKSTVRPIQPKITNATDIVSKPTTQSNVLHGSIVNNLLSQKSQNLTQKKVPEQPVVSQEKCIIKPIKPLKNKIVKDYEKGVCTIKLSSNLLKRIQNGEKLFMCMECDKVYTKHEDLLDHQLLHNKCDKNMINQEKEKKEKLFGNNVKDLSVVENRNKIKDNTNVIKQSKPIWKSSVNPKKQKVVFQGECIMCHSVFPDLGKHLRTVHQNDLIKNKINNRKYDCFKCDMKFYIKQQLIAHEMSAHKPTNTFVCEHCFKEFSLKEDLETHIESHFSDSMKYLCPYCDTGFPHSNGLRIHLTKHIDFNNSENSTIELSPSQIDYSPTRPPEHLDQLFEELTSITDDGDKIYVEQVADDNFQVRFSKDEDRIGNISKDSFVDPAIDMDLNKVKLKDNNQITIDQHQTTSSSSIKNRISYTVCRICMVIVSYSRIGRHMKKKHNNAAPYQCEICHAEFNRKHIMDDHRRKHTNNKPHKCIECSKCFTYKHHLNRHMMIVHNADSLEKAFKCSVCDKAFSFKEYLTLHVNSRHKGKHYMCQICGKSFSTNAALNKHQLCHTDERPFMCEHCGRTFKCKTHCDTHKKNMHPGDPHLALPPEKFECDLCNKKFSTKVYRDMHFKRHNGQGHQCDICYKLFVSKAHMQRHLKIMHQN